MNIQLDTEAYSHLDKNAHALLKRMLLADPNQRITAAEALNHPYFFGIGEDEKVSSPVATSVGSHRRGGMLVL